MAKLVTDTPRISAIIWHIQKRLREKGFEVATDGDPPPKLAFDTSETRKAILAHLGGPVPDAGVPLAVLVEPYFMYDQTPGRPPSADMPAWSAKAGEALARCPMAEPRTCSTSHCAQASV